MGSLYTIGHSRYNFKYFLKLLQKYKVNFLLYVRSVPYSKYADTFNKEHLTPLLSTNGINYFYMGKCFGSRLNDIYLYCKDGYLDFEKISHSENFVKGEGKCKVWLEKRIQYSFNVHRKGSY